MYEKKVRIGYWPKDDLHHARLALQHPNGNPICVLSRTLATQLRQALGLRPREWYGAMLRSEPGRFVVELDEKESLT